MKQLLRKPALMAFDYDGTLAPICAEPKVARITASWSARLKRINRRWPVAVISGRKLADLSSRLGFDPAYMAGNHGAESSMTPALQTVARCLDAARGILAKQGQALTAFGIVVEDKGMSLAVHYRLAHPAQEAAAFIARLLVALPAELVVSHGKAVFNIMLRAAPDKGDALLSAMRSCGVDHALYVGDDVNDEPAFAAATPASVTVRLGSRLAPTHARFAIATHWQFGLLLRTLANWHC
ncbi:MAG: trehalose-phosphatase [Rhodoferax sp.]|nr:trehalose-phosphatase [Rhodoferax sp.]